MSSMSSAVQHTGEREKQNVGDRKGVQRAVTDMTYFASIELVAFAVDLDQSTSHRIEGGETGDMRVPESPIAGFTVVFCLDELSSAAVGDLTEELMVDVTQRARHCD